MKRMLIVALALMLSGVGAAAQDPSDLFNRAVHLQDVKGDLEAAIPLFQRVVTGSTDAPLAGKAQLRMAMCYEKLGRDEAYDAYQKVIRDFATQADLVGLAKEKLSRLKRTTSAGAGTGNGFTLTKIYSGRTYAASLSPDGKRLVLVRSELSSRDLWTRDVASGKEVRLTTQVTVSADQAWSPDSRWIAFADRDREIKVVSVDGGPVRTLFTPGPADNTAGIVPTGWTPDSRKVVFHIPSKGLFAVAAAGGTSEPVLTYPNPDEAKQHAAMTLSPDGRWIAYSAIQNGNADIYVVPVTGQGPVRVTATPATEKKPRWSPDGRWLAYTSTGTENPQIWAIKISSTGQPEGTPVPIAKEGHVVVADWTSGSRVGVAATFRTDHIFAANADGTGEIQLSQFDAFNARPTWSPNGDTIAFRSDYRKPMNRYQLWTVPSAGAPPRLVSDREVGRFAWSRDGETLLFETNSGRAIMEIPARGGEPRDITPKPGGSTDGPSFWPDGRGQCSAFAIDPPKFATADDYLKEVTSGIGVALGGGESRILIPADKKGIQYMDCRLSPDGKRIAYIVFDYAQYEKAGMYSVWTMDVDGGSRKQITLGGEYALAWTPDGKWIVFEKRIKDMDFDLYKILADGGAPVQMNIKGQRPEFSPDGKRIVFARSIDYGYEYWLVENALPALPGKTK